MELDENFLSLIGGIYDSALIPELWDTVLPRIGAFVGGSGGGLFAHHNSRTSASIYHQFGTDPDYRQLYLEKYMTMDPMFGTYFVLDIGEVFSSSTIMPHPEFLQSRFYREWVQPQGWYDNIGVYLDRSAEGHAAFVIFRNEREGIAEDPARERMGHERCWRSVRISSSAGEPQFPSPERHAVRRQFTQRARERVRNCRWRASGL
jgi:hypothetical protein